MNLTVTESVSLDGVMQGLGGPDEDRRGGFERGGWQIPLSDEEVGAFLNDVYARADAFLFGRRMYEIFAGSWGLMKDPSQSPIGQALHARRKYVASSTLTEPRWADTTVIAGQVAALSELKAKPGGELQVHGSGALVRWLLENELVDEIKLLTFPVIIGQGTRLRSAKAHASSKGRREHPCPESVSTLRWVPALLRSLVRERSPSERRCRPCG
jgi:dihydrofolate reductase